MSRSRRLKTILALLMLQSSLLDAYSSLLTSILPYAERPDDAPIPLDL
jgi:hypothetical protein